jgi:hypothetical protein
MFGWRRGNTRGGCIIIPCGCVASPLVLLSGAVLFYAGKGLKIASNFVFASLREAVGAVRVCFNSRGGGLVA